MSQRFNDDQIKRSDLPADVFGILHDLCYDVPSRDRRQYRRRARVALKVNSRFSAVPRHLGWLVKTLMRAYPSRVFVLGIIGDIAKLIVKRRKLSKISNTTCIACGGWIPKEREDRGQHACCDACQNWYRVLMRAIDAEKVCRYCGHGLKKPTKAIRRVRPKPVIRLGGQEPERSNSGLGATRQPYVVPPVRVPYGANLPLIPNTAQGVELEAVRDALEGN